MNADTRWPICRLSPVLVCAVLVACSQPPQARLSRTLERAASWASAAEFGTEATRAGSAPNAFADDLYRRGQEDVEQIARSIEKLDVDPRERADAVQLCTRLAGALAAAQSGRADRAMLESLHHELQQFAARAGTQ